MVATMAALTLQQIDAILEQARQAGLEPAEIEGLRSALLMRTAQPSNVDKLALSVSMLPTSQAASVETFISDLDAMRKQQLASAKADLMSMSDEEWQALVDEANSKENTGND
jgi:hypothetical protein